MSSHHRPPRSSFIATLHHATTPTFPPSDPTCAICLDPYAPAWKIRNPDGSFSHLSYHLATQMPCGHFFGYGCVKRWLAEGSSTCPMCRVRFFEEEEEEEEEEEVVEYVGYAFEMFGGVEVRREVREWRVEGEEGEEGDEIGEEGDGWSSCEEDESGSESECEIEYEGRDEGMRGDWLAGRGLWSR